MKKLKLEDLEVDSFTTTGQRYEVGTVHALEAELATLEAECGPYTQGGPTCDPTCVPGKCCSHAITTCGNDQVEGPG